MVSGNKYSERGGCKKKFKQVWNSYIYNPEKGKPMMWN